MEILKALEDFETLQKTTEKEGMHLFYFSRPDCGMCGALKPKVKSMVKNFPEMKSYYVDLDIIPEAAGQLSILTIPAVLVYAEGKEVVREARYISMDQLSEKVNRPYRFIYG